MFLVQPFTTNFVIEVLLIALDLPWKSLAFVTPSLRGLAMFPNTSFIAWPCFPFMLLFALELCHDFCTQPNQYPVKSAWLPKDCDEPFFKDLTASMSSFYSSEMLCCHVSVAWIVWSLLFYALLSPSLLPSGSQTPSFHGHPSQHCHWLWHLWSALPY